MAKKIIGKDAPGSTLASFRQFMPSQKKQKEAEAKTKITLDRRLTQLMEKRKNAADLFVGTYIMKAEANEYIRSERHILTLRRRRRIY